MGVDFSVSLVNWEELTEAVHRSPPIELDEISDLFPPEPEADGGSWGAASELWERFKGLRNRWRSPAVDAFAELFGTLFWSWQSGYERVDDLGLPIDNRLGIDSAWSPRTVVRFASLWRQIDLESCRQVFQDVSSDLPCSTFEEFKAAALEWGKLILRGAEQKRGLVVFIAF